MARAIIPATPWVFTDPSWWAKRLAADVDGHDEATDDHSAPHHGYDPMERYWLHRVDLYFEQERMRC